MSKVYVIFRGKYEDRIIEAIFSLNQLYTAVFGLNWKKAINIVKSFSMIILFCIVASLCSKVLRKVLHPYQV